MSEEEMKALVEMNNMLKAKLEQQTKTYQQSLREMQSEIDNLQRNCDVFNEQMNDAVERATELQIENNKLKQDNQELKRIVKTCKCGGKHYFTNCYNEVYDKQKELISDQEICIKNTLQSLNEWKEYAERLEELIDKIKKHCKECGSTNIKQNYKPYKIAEDILQILNDKVVE